MYESNLTSIRNVEEIKYSLLDIRLEVKSHLSTTNPNDRKTFEDAIKASQDDISKNINSFRSQKDITDEEKKLADSLDKAISEYIDSANTTIKLSDDLKLDEADKNGKASKSKYDAVVTALDALVKNQAEEANSFYKNSQRVHENTGLELGLLTIVCIILGILLCIIITKAIVTPIKKVTSKLDDIAQNGGDLTQRIGINTKDEVGQLSKSFDSFIGKLQGMMKEISDASINVASSSKQLTNATSVTNKSLEQISVTINNIAQSTSDNVATTEETTAGLNESAQFMETTLESSNKTSEYSIKVKKAAEESDSKVSEIVTSINNIFDSSKEVSGLISDLGKSSSKIGEFIQVITAIAEQTNLLALNAAIEAARAGENGRGFAVVAEEIRKLADESNKSAKEIVAQVKDNLIKTETAVKSVNEVGGIISSGVELAEAVKENIHNIIGNIEDVAVQVSDINQAIEKQTTISKEISKAMNSISENAGDMAAGTEEMSATIEEQVSTMEEIEATASHLAEMAGKLQDITSKFKV